MIEVVGIDHVQLSMPPDSEDEARGLRCYIRDPFGNRIELDDERDAGFSAG